MGLDVKFPVTSKIEVELTWATLADIATQAGEPNRYCTEASTMGFRPGIWPDEVRLHYPKVGLLVLKVTGREIDDERNTLVSVHYGTEQHPFNLVVFND